MQFRDSHNFRLFNVYFAIITISNQPTKHSFICWSCCIAQLLGATGGAGGHSHKSTHYMSLGIIVKSRKRKSFILWVQKKAKMSIWLPPGSHNICLKDLLKSFYFFLQPKRMFICKGFFLFELECCFSLAPLTSYLLLATIWHVKLNKKHFSRPLAWQQLEMSMLHFWKRAVWCGIMRTR